MDNELVNLARLLVSECDWEINLDDLESPFNNPFIECSHKELGLPDDIKIELQGYQVRPARGFEDKMQIYFLSIKGSGRLHVTRLRAILKELARKGKRARHGGDASIYIDVQDIVFICSLLEKENVTRYFCHFQDAGPGNLPKLMIGPKWEDNQPKKEQELAKDKLRKYLQWPDDSLTLVEWRENWARAFSVEHLYVPKTSKQLAQRLATLAIEIRQSIPEIYKLEDEEGPIHSLLNIFRESLIDDLTLEDFGDMIAQTISYGLFSARATGKIIQGVDSLSEILPPTNPFLMNLFAEFSKFGGSNAGDLDFDDFSLGDLIQTLNLSKIELILDEFGSQFKHGKEDPIIHFYETFLKEYHPKKRFDHGVFYTPRSAVNYMVRTVHKTLIEEHGFALGLADASTYKMEGNEFFNITILDPATGTGTFMVAVVELIYEVMKRHWKSSGKSDVELVTLWNEYVDEKLLPRLFGFELMMAPYVIAHMQLNLALIRTGYTSHAGGRLNIILTNSLNDITEVAAHVPDFISSEADLANKAKLENKFSVVIGNPPYKYDGRNNHEFIQKLVKSYYFVDGASINEKNPKGLRDDYVKFFKFSEHLINQTGFGVISLLTNHSFLDNPTFKGMRKSLLDSFNCIEIIDLHGNKIRKEKAPSGGIDENIFPIKQGVSITNLSLTKGDQNLNPSIKLVDLYGPKTEKLTSLEDGSPGARTEILPKAPEYLFIHDEDVYSDEWEKSMAINDIFPNHRMGMYTANDSFTICHSVNH